jgi:hypothetical protein
LIFEKNGFLKKMDFRKKGLKKIWIFERQFLKECEKMDSWKSG